MRLVSAAFVVLACLAAPATAGAEGFSGEPLSMGAFASAAKVISYGGSTSQDGPVIFQLSRDARRLVRLAIHWDAACGSGGSIYLGGGYKGSLTLSRGGFSSSTTASLAFGDFLGEVTQEFRGRFNGRSGSGTWHAHVVLTDPATGATVDECDTGTLRWSTPGPQGLVYAGLTSKGEPFVLILSRSRREVAELRFGWSSTCDPSGTYGLGDDLVKFPISRSGAFGDVFKQTFPTSDGGSNVFDYDISGKVGRASATGRFRAKLTRMDPSGAVTQTCDAGLTRFNARQ